MIQIVPLDESCRGKELTFRYQTAYYYDVSVQERPDGAVCRLEKKAFPEPVEKSFTDVLLGDWLEEPQLFGAVSGDRIVGYLELSHERWNNRMRISNIWVAEGDRRKGVGRRLMEQAVSAAKQAGARALVLETQSCNWPAISFYQKHGFYLTGFDLTAYSQEDVQKKEVRLELARPVFQE